MPENKIQITLEALNNFRPAFDELQSSLSKLGEAVNKQSVLYDQYGKVIQTSKEKTADLGKQTQETSSTTTSAGGKINDTIAGIKTAYLLAAGEIYAAYALIMKAFDWAEIGARAKQTEEAYGNVTRSMGVNTEGLLSKMKEAGYVWVEQTGIMQQATRLLAEGVKEDDIVGLVEAARVAARFMGTDVEEAFNRIVFSVVSLQTRGLRQAFPMDLTKVNKDYADSLKVDVDLLNEFGLRYAIVNEILKQSPEKKKLLGGVLDPSDIEILQRVKSAISDAKEAAGRDIDEIIMAFATLAQRTNYYLNMVEEGIRDFIKAIPGLSTVIKALGGLSEPEAKPAPGTTAVQGQGPEIEAARKAQAEKDKIDRDKFNKEMGKINADAALERVKVSGEIQALGLEAEKGAAIAAARATSEDTYLIEEQYAKKAAQMEFDTTVANLKAQAAAEIAAAVQAGKTREIPPIRDKERQEEVKAQAKYNADLSKIMADRTAMINEAQRKAVQAERGITPEMEPFAPTPKAEGEQDKRSRDFWVERQKATADFAKQLADLTHNYDEVTEAQVKQIEAERAAYVESEAFGKLSNDQQQQYLSLINLRINKTRELRELEKTQNLADLRKQVAELSGDWDKAKQAEIEYLNAELKVKLATQDLTDAQRQLLVEIKNQKAAELEAQRTMNAPALMDIGGRKATIQANQDLANQFENLLPNSINVFTDAIKQTDGTFRTFFANLGQGFVKLLQDISFAIVKMEILKSLGYGSGGGGGILEWFGRLIGGGGGGATLSGSQVGLTMYPVGGMMAEGGLIPTWKPIAALQEGGLVNKATLGVIGEAGPEAVIPLDKMKGMGQTVINNHFINVHTMDPISWRDYLRRWGKGPVMEVISEDANAPNGAMRNIIRRFT